MTQWTIPATNLLSPASDYELTFNMSRNEPVRLRIYRAEARFLKIFRIVLEKYNTSSSIKSSFREKIDFSVNGKILSLPRNISNGNLSIYDLVGKQVFDYKVNSNRIDLQNINPGIYIVKLIAQQGEETKKIIIK